MEGESGEQVRGELDSVTSSAGCCVQGWRNETGSWFQRWGDAWRNEQLVILRKVDVGGLERVTTDEEW